jgi:hypothetical protein
VTVPVLFLLAAVVACVIGVVVVGIARRSRRSGSTSVSEFSDRLAALAPDREEERRRGA